MKQSNKYNLLFLVFCIIGLIFFNGTFSGEISDSSLEIIEYHFRNDEALEDHYKKHGIDMGYSTSKDYEEAASDVINNPDSLHKLEKEDNDDCYYLEETNEFVIVSKDGNIRTYFYPDSGKSYFDNQ